MLISWKLKCKVFNIQPQPHPCQNNGTCHDLVNDYRCECIVGFNGTNCEKSIKISSSAISLGSHNLNSLM